MDFKNCCDLISLKGFFEDLELKKEITIAVIFFFLGGFRKTFFHWLLSVRKSRRLKALLKKNDQHPNSLVIAIDHPSPFYKKENVHLSDKSENFFLSASSEYKAELKKLNFELREESFFQRSISEIDTITEIDGLHALILKVRNDVACRTAEKIRAGHILFNGQMYGVRRIYGGRTVGAEDSQLRIDFYTTDYFTYMVMVEVYNRLIKRNYDFGIESNFVSLAKYYPLFASFGLCCFVIIDKGYGDEVMLCKRTNQLEAFPGKWHFSMNEALSLKDIDSEIIDSTPDFRSCAMRGLKEELGISKDRIEKFEIMDLVFGQERCELGIFTYARAIINDGHTFQDLINSNAVAQDSKLEVKETKFVALDKLDKFIKENRTQLSEPCALGLGFLNSRYKSGYLK